MVETQAAEVVIVSFSADAETSLWEQEARNITVEQANLVCDLELCQGWCRAFLQPQQKHMRRKATSGIRPVVVGKFLSGLVSKAVIKEVDHTLPALQPAEIGAGGKLPVI